MGMDVAANEVIIEKADFHEGGGRDLLKNKVFNATLNKKFDCKWLCSYI